MSEEQTQGEPKVETITVNRGEGGKFIKKADETLPVGLSEEEIDIIPLKNYFTVETFNNAFDEDFRFINQWAREKGIKNRDDLFLQIRKIEDRLGPSQLGESRVARLKNYLKLDKELDSVHKEMSSYERK